MNGSIEKLKELLALHSPVFRRTILVIVPLFAVSLFVVATFVEAFNQNLGFKVAIAALPFFIGVLVEHVASNVTRLEDMTTTVKTLDSGIQQIKSSVGVQEGVEVHERDSMASRRQLEIIDGRKPQRVKLCEYSSGAVKGQLEHLAAAETTESVRLLVCHPDRAINSYQTERILNQLTALSNSVSIEIARRMGLEIRCYVRPASIRGRSYDNEYVVVGWYTYDIQPQSSDPIQIWGEENPVVIAPQGHPHGKALAQLFDRVFEHLWQEAVPLQRALSNQSGGHKPSAPWIEQVSQPQSRP